MRFLSLSTVRCHAVSFDKMLSENFVPYTFAPFVNIIVAIVFSKFAFLTSASNISMLLILERCRTCRV